MTNLNVDKAPVNKPPVNKPPRDSRGRLLPGHGSLNPGGRTKDRRTIQGDIYKILKKVEKKKGESFLEHYITRAFKDKTMAIALLKKLIPDLKAVEVTDKNKEVWNIILQQFTDSKLGVKTNETENKN